jgi:hypothetical protein
MKKEYDFSKGERGKFSDPDAQLNLPLRLDSEVFTFVEAIAKKRKSDISSVVNELLRGDMAVAKVLQD